MKKIVCSIVLVMSITLGGIASTYRVEKEHKLKASILVTDLDSMVTIVANIENMSRIKNFVKEPGIYLIRSKEKSLSESIAEMMSKYNGVTQIPVDSSKIVELENMKYKSYAIIKTCILKE